MNESLARRYSSGRSYPLYLKASFLSSCLSKSSVGGKFTEISLLNSFITAIYVFDFVGVLSFYEVSSFRRINGDMKS